MCLRSTLASHHFGMLQSLIYLSGVSFTLKGPNVSVNGGMSNSHLFSWIILIWTGCWIQVCGKGVLLSRGTAVLVIMVSCGLLSGRICSLPPAQVPRVLPVSHLSILFPTTSWLPLSVQLPPGAEGRSSGRPYSPPSYLCAAFLSRDPLGWNIHLPLLWHCDFVILIEN